LKKIDLWHDPENDGSASYWWASTGEESPGKKSKRKYCGKEEQIGDHSSAERYKRETTPQDEDIGLSYVRVTALMAPT
jgi:hypothetical protein